MTHVDADLGEDRAGGGAADAGDLLQPVGRRRERDDQLLELGVQLGDVGVQRIHPGQHPGQQEPVMVGEEPGEGSSRTLRLARIRPRASSASTLGSRSPAMSAASIARPETPKMSEATTLSLIWASSSRFSTRCFSAVRTPPDRRGSGPRPAADRSPVAGRSWAPASAARRPWQARPRPVGLGPAGQVLDVLALTARPQPLGLQQVDRGLPIVAGGLHGHPGHAQLTQPIGQHQQRPGHRGGGLDLLQAPAPLPAPAPGHSRPAPPCRYPTPRPAR
jgi:hypothetical protein